MGADRGEGELAALRVGDLESGVAPVEAYGGRSRHDGGGHGPNPLAEDQLAALRGAGLGTAAYVYLPPDDTAETGALVAAAVAALGDERSHIAFVAVDVEGAKVLYEPDPDARLRDCLDQLSAQLPGVPQVIYTGNVAHGTLGWNAVMKKSTAFADLPLWDVRYPGGERPTDEAFDSDFRPYGGWSERALWQYAGDRVVDGLKVDEDLWHPDRIKR